VAQDTELVRLIVDFDRLTLAQIRESGLLINEQADKETALTFARIEILHHLKHSLFAADKKIMESIGDPDDANIVRYEVRKQILASVDEFVTMILDPKITIDKARTILSRIEANILNQNMTAVFELARLKDKHSQKEQSATRGRNAADFGPRVSELQIKSMMDQGANNQARAKHTHLEELTKEIGVPLEIALTSLANPI
jgi:hypothetical protein